VAQASGARCDPARYPQGDRAQRACCGCPEQAPFYLYTAFRRWAYIKDHLHQEHGRRAGRGSPWAGALELLLIPTFGNLSDRLGPQAGSTTTGAILMGHPPRFPFFPPSLNNRVPWASIILGTALIAIPHRHPVRPAVLLHRGGNFPTGLAYGRERAGLPGPPR